MFSYIKKTLTKKALIYWFGAFFLLIFSVFVVSSSNRVLAQTSSTPTEERKTLENELKKLEEEIAQYEKDITKTQAEKKTLQNQISVIKGKIQKLDLQIKQSNLMIQDLSVQIKDTEQSIEKTSQKIEESRSELSNILRAIYEEDQKSPVEVLLAEDNLSDFFNNLANLESLQSRNQDLLKEIKSLKTSLEDQKNLLDSDKTDLEQMARIQTLQKQEQEATRKQNEKLLEQTKGKESEYQKILAASKKRAAEIKSRIFELIGIPQAPTFEEALNIAKYAESLTGIRPAFLLAILTQESNLGKNVGQCYLVNQNTGEGTGVKSGNRVSRVMSPARDVPIFLSITKDLGRDPFKTVVSCPMSFGWGGAMGPAQFIPSTWALYDSQVESFTGQPADPWSIKDAFIASALYLKKSGAGAKDYNSEWRAALIYFSGSVNTRYRFYGDSVMTLARQYQSDIDEIEN